MLALIKEKFLYFALLIFTIYMELAASEIDGQSLDITTHNIERLKALFPDVFTEGKIDFARLRQALGVAVNTSGEHYELSWAGKSEARKEVQKQTTATLMPDREGSINFDNSENIFIEGENLEVLRVLQKSYFGKVKMIYIDPPYNTGNDSFVYPDDYSERQDEYNRRTGITGEGGFLNKQDLWKKNTKENGQFHSVWLSMMYPRLYLARNLLREDEVIFISIDDNEQANLKLLMDEVFGEENAIGQLIWKRRQNVDSRAKKGISVDHEYMLCYSKSSERVIQGAEKDLTKYSNPDNDPRGNWMSDNMVGLATREQRPNLHYDLEDPKTGIVYKCPPTGWRYEPKRLYDLVKNDEVLFPSKPDGRPRRKKFLNDLESDFTGFSTILNTVFNTQGTREVRTLFDEKEYFNFPKPKDLIKLLLKQGLDKDKGHIALDFFAGSATTAHAVLELNKEDGGNRKFILVQMPEPSEEISEAYKAGYKTIADISKARIKKVFQKLISQKEGKIEFDTDSPPLGFQAYKLAPSNFKQWRGDLQSKEDILAQLELFTQNAKPEAKTEAMLTELLLKAGLPLTTRVQTEQTAEGAFYFLPQINTCISLNAFGPETRNAVYERKPIEVIVLNSLFQSDEALSNTKLEYTEAGINLTLI